LALHVHCYKDRGLYLAIACAERPKIILVYIV